MPSMVFNAFSRLPMPSMVSYAFSGLSISPMISNASNGFQCLQWTYRASNEFPMPPNGTRQRYKMVLAGVLYLENCQPEILWPEERL